MKLTIFWIVSVLFTLTANALEVSENARAQITGDFQLDGYQRYKTTESVAAGKIESIFHRVEKAHLRFDGVVECQIEEYTISASGHISDRRHSDDCKEITTSLQIGKVAKVQLPCEGTNPLENSEGAFGQPYNCKDMRPIEVGAGGPILRLDDLTYVKSDSSRTVGPATRWYKIRVVDSLEIYQVIYEKQKSSYGLSKRTDLKEIFQYRRMR